MIRDLALFAARQAIGQGMAAHGAQKALGWFEGPGPVAAAQMMHGLGFRPGETYARLASWTEIVSGELIAVGLGGPIGPAMLLSSMIVAQRSVHWPNGFFAQKGGIELGLVYGAAALTFAVSDYGSLSADALLGRRATLKNPIFTTLTLAGAVSAALLILGSRRTAPDEPATPTYRGKNSPLPEVELPATQA